MMSALCDDFNKLQVKPKFYPKFSFNKKKQDKPPGGPILDTSEKKGELSSMDLLGPPNEFGVRLQQIHLKDSIIHPVLKFYQKETVKWMIERENNLIHGVRGGINSSFLGSGKSIETLTVVMRDYSLPETPKFPTLIICPLSALYTWRMEIDKFLGESCPYLVVHDIQTRFGLTLEEIQKYKVVITNYETIRTIARKHDLYEDKFMLNVFDKKVGIFPSTPPTSQMLQKTGDIMLFNTPWHRIVCDESHTMGNPRSQLFYSIMCLYSERKWGLSGTPIRNYSSDLFSQFRFLGFHDVLRAQDFNHSVYSSCSLDKCILYMTEEDANIKLPEMKVVLVPIKFTFEESRFYNYFQKRTVDAHRGFLFGCVSFINVLTLFLRLRQCCIAPYIISEKSARNYNKNGNSSEGNVVQDAINEMPPEIVEWMNDMYGVAGMKSSKVVKTMEIIQEHLQLGQKGIVFTSFTRYIDVLIRAFGIKFEGVNYEVIDGSVTGTKRDDALNRFKSGSSQVLFISYKVGAESLNITEAQYIILEETVWNPAMEIQAQGRIHRIGQEKEVIIYKLIAADTIEQKMIDICNKKRELFNQFISSKKPAEHKIDSHLLQQLISL